MTDGRPCGKPDGHGGPHLSAEAHEREKASLRITNQTRRSTPGPCGVKDCYEPRQQLSLGKYADYCAAHKILLTDTYSKNSYKKISSTPGPCGVKDCDEPRQQFSSGKYAIYCADHKKMFRGDRKAGTCGVKDCDEPRQQLSSGKYNSYCATHQRKHSTQWRRSNPDRAFTLGQKHQALRRVKKYAEQFPELVAMIEEGIQKS
jgi:hypothetical protein